MACANGLKSTNNTDKKKPPLRLKFLCPQNGKIKHIYNKKNSNQIDFKLQLKIKKF